jgi:hypothetical protein
MADNPKPMAAGPDCSTGLPGLDRVLRGLRPGDNLVWGVDCIDEYVRLARPYVAAACQRGQRVVYFRFAPLFDESSGLENHSADPALGFERFVRAIHRVIEDCGPGTVHVFDSISCLAGILRSESPELASRLEVHDSFFVGADVFVTFRIRNGVWWIREAQTREQGFLKDLGEGRRRIHEGQFTPKALSQFESMLDYFGERPCIVRSSSIPEDARGNAFSGKYESVFLPNRGSREERLDALLDAIRSVYASVLDPEALLYRKSRGLLESEERMALLIMRVSGRQRGQAFFPQAAGVGLSYNPWCWHPDIDPEAGVARLVFGLGTRAVDRADEDYTRLVSLSVPLRRPETSLDEQHDQSQRRMDLIDLDERALVSRPVEEIVPQCCPVRSRALGNRQPLARHPGARRTDCPGLCRL